MGLGLFSCCTGGSARDVRSPGQGHPGKRGGNLAGAAHATSVSLPDANVISSGEPVSKKLSEIVQDLLIRLPQVTGHTWISRLEASMTLLSSVTEVDAASVALVVPTDGDGAAAAMPYASVVCGAGPYGSVLQQHQQLGNKAALLVAGRSGEEPFTSSHVLMAAPPGEVLLLSSETSAQVQGLGDSALTSVCSAGGGTGELPTDWAAVAAGTHLRQFCGLPLRVGPRLLAVMTLAWAAPLHVPPGLRGNCVSGPGRGAAAAGAGLMHAPSQHSSPAPQQPRQPSGAYVVGGCGPAAGPPASEAERSCLTQLAQVLSLGLFGDVSSVVYGQKVARMIHGMTLAATLQAVLDGLMAGVRDLLLHRCQQDLSATLALKHTNAPTAAFILEGRVSPLSPPQVSLPPRPGTASGHLASASAAQPRSGGPPASIGGAGSASTSAMHRSTSGQPARGGAGPMTHPAPQRLGPVQGGGGVAAAPGISAPGLAPPGQASNAGGNAGANSGNNNPNNPMQNSSNATASFNNAQLSNAANSSMNLASSGGAGGSTWAAGRASTSSHFKRGRSGDVRGVIAAAAAGGVGGGGAGPAGPGPAAAAAGPAVSGGVISGMFRHTMSVDLNASMDADSDLPSTVHAHITSLAHTLLMASLSALAPPDAADDVTAAGAVATAATTIGTGTMSKYSHLSGASERGDLLTPIGRRELGGYMPLQGRSSGAGRLVGATGSTGGVGPAGGGQAGAAAATVTPQGCVIPNCHLHLQDESLPCRDLVLVQKLARMPVQSLVLVVVRPADLAASLMSPPVLLDQGSNTVSGHPAGASTSASNAGADSATVFAPTMPPLGLYLTSAEPLARSALQAVISEAREAVRLAAATLYRQMSAGSLRDEWNGLLEAMSAAAYAGRMSYGSSRMVSLLRPRSCNMLQEQVGSQEQASSELLPYGIVNSPSRGHMGTSPGVLSSELSKPLASGRVVLDSSVEQPLQQLDAMVSSIQSTLSTVQLQLDIPGNAAEMQEMRLNDIAAVELMEIIGRGGQGVVFRGVVHGIEAAVKVISHRDEADAAAAPKNAPGSSAGEKRLVAGGDGSTRPRGGAPAALESPLLVVDEARMRERKRNMLRDALELAVTTTISHPNIVQMYGYFTDCVVVQYANQSNRLKLLPADSEALQQYGSQRGPVNTVMCMEYCDAGTLKSVAEAGSFRMPGVSAKSGPACPALVPLYTSLLELALALRHLHSRRLVHCDLKPSNVLLKSSLRDPRGWICKLSDFGCVRVMNEEVEEGRLGFRQPQPLGTLTHMAPEMFVRGGLLDGGVDIYAFGIIMWELIMVAPLYDGTVPKEKLPSMIRRGLRPIFHPLVPPEYRMLATACWQEDPRRRPTAAVLVSMLQRLLSRAQATAASTSSPSSISGGRAGKSMSSSFSGVAQPHAAANASNPLPNAEPEAASSGGGGGGTPPARRMYAGVPRRNTVASNLGVAAAGGGGAPPASGQRQAFPPPVSSPLSREAGPAARAAVRVGDSSGAKPPPTRMAEPPMQLPSPGGSMQPLATISPLGTGLGQAAAPPSVAAVAAVAAAGACSSPVAASIASAAGMAGSAPEPGPSDDAPGRQSPLQLSSMVAVAAGEKMTATVVTAATAAAGVGLGLAGDGVGASSPRGAETRPSSLLGIGNTTAAETNRNSLSSASGAAVSAAGSAAAAAAAGAAASTPRMSVEPVPARSVAAERDTLGDALSDDVLPVRGELFVSGTAEPLSSSTVHAANTGELVGL